MCELFPKKEIFEKGNCHISLKLKTGGGVMEMKKADATQAVFDFLKIWNWRNSFIGINTSSVGLLFESGVRRSVSDS